jgi:hypothetical protein
MSSVHASRGWTVTCLLRSLLLLLFLLLRHIWLVVLSNVQVHHKPLEGWTQPH